MMIHYLKNKTQIFPTMRTNWKDRNNNTNKNLKDFFKQLQEISQYMMIFDHETGKLDIWYFGPYSQEYKVSMYNTSGARTVEIRYFFSGLEVRSECHGFNPFGFSALVNKYFLTQNELDKQKLVKQQEPKHEEVLERKHNLIPQTCGGVDKCKHCQDEESYNKMPAPLPIGRYT